MPMSQKNKIYFGIVACGLAALITDRATRSSDPSGTASASSVTSAQLLVPANQRINSIAPARSAVNAPSVAELLRETAIKAGWKSPSRAHGHNPFANEQTNAAGTPSSQSAAMFVQSHHLSAIIDAAGQGCAMIDGRICSVGQTIDGFKLTAVTAGAVVFQSAQERIVLRLRGFLPFRHADGTH